MKIVRVLTSNKLSLHLGDRIIVRFFNIVNDEEDKQNPVTKYIFIEAFEPTEDGSLIKIIGDDGEAYYDDNIVDKI